jgi:hypothetical protein
VKEKVSVEAASVSGQEVEPREVKRASKWEIDPNELMTSTTEHRLWTYGGMSVMGCLFLQSVHQAQGVGDGVTIGLSVAMAYLLADLGTGIYHWSVDNYGDGQTPLVGKQIAAFQGHHQKPWTITKRDFANNLHLVFRPATFPALLFLALSPWAPIGWNAFSSTFLFLICMSQQFHAFAHMKKSELPEIIVRLQDAGILISRRAHGQHHRPPFEGNYCIVSGLWNSFLDSSGFLRRLEEIVKSITGIEPRCWHPPEYEIEEEEAGTAALN